MRSSLVIVTFTSLIGLSVACSTSKQIAHKTSHYSLDEHFQSRKSDENKSSGLALGIGPILLPGYLDRPQLVRESRQGKLLAHDLHRWEEPLSLEIQKFLAQEMTSKVPMAHIELHPWRRAHQMDFQWKLQIHRFENDSSSQEMQLKGDLEFIHLKSRRILRKESFDLKHSLQTDEISEQVEAMRSLLKVLVARMTEMIPSHAERNLVRNRSASVLSSERLDLPSNHKDEQRQ
jgi:uncharacterized lipoprotein YmbA